MCRVLASGVCGSYGLELVVAREVPSVLGHELIGGSWRSATTSWASPWAIASSSTITRRAASAGATTAATDPVRAPSGPRARPGRFRRAGPRSGRPRRQLLASTASTPRGELVEPLAYVLRSFDRAACAPATPCSSSAAGHRPARDRRRPRAAVEAVWAREPRPERLERALALGAERHGNEFVDVVMVCTPKPDAIAAGFAAVAPGGALCLYAPPDPGHALGLDGHALYVGEVDVCASYSAGPADMRAALGQGGSTRCPSSRIAWASTRRAARSSWPAAARRSRSWWRRERRAGRAARRDGQRRRRGARADLRAQRPLQASLPGGRVRRDGRPAIVAELAAWWDGPGKMSEWRAGEWPAGAALTVARDGVRRRHYLHLSGDLVAGQMGVRDGARRPGRRRRRARSSSA